MNARPNRARAAARPSFGFGGQHLHLDRQIALQGRLGDPALQGCLGGR
jgi:hypothetical protein